jgi:hypothetical protein
MFDSRWNKIFPSFTEPRLALRPTQSTMQWVRGGGHFTRLLSHQCVKLTIHLHLVPRSRIVEQYLQSPLCLHGNTLNSLSTGTIYSFFALILWSSVMGTGVLPQDEGEELNSRSVSNPPTHTHGRGLLLRHRELVPNNVIGFE